MAYDLFSGLQSARALVAGALSEIWSTRGGRGSSGSGAYHDVQNGTVDEKKHNGRGEHTSRLISLHRHADFAMDVFQQHLK